MLYNTEKYIHYICLHILTQQMYKIFLPTCRKGYRQTVDPHMDRWCGNLKMFKCVQLYCIISMFLKFYCYILSQKYSNCNEGLNKSNINTINILSRLGYISVSHKIFKTKIYDSTDNFPSLLLISLFWMIRWCAFGPFGKYKVLIYN